MTKICFSPLLTRPQGCQIDTPCTPGGASIVEWNKFWSFRSLWEGRAFFSPRVRLNCSCQVVGHNRSSSLRYDQDFFCTHFLLTSIFYAHFPFRFVFWCLLVHSNRVALQSKSCQSEIKMYTLCHFYNCTKAEMFSKEHSTSDLQTPLPTSWELP